MGEDATGIPAMGAGGIAAVAERAGFESSFALLMCAVVILVTSLALNMVTLLSLMPLAWILAQSLKIADPVALGLVLGIRFSLDSPCCRPALIHDAIVAGSGSLRVKTMVRYGAILFVIHTDPRLRGLSPASSLGR